MRLAASWSLLPLLSLLAPVPAFAATELRFATDVRGDFILIGNTLGHSCATRAPVVGTVGRCVERSRFPDLSPDLFWRAGTSSAAADASVTPDRMRSTAVLAVPPGATVRQAYLYWWGEVDDVAPDPDVVLERPGVQVATFTATRSDSAVQVNADAVQPTYAETLDYLSVTDVTDFVVLHGSGPYRVSGVGAHPLADNFNIAYAGWALVVIYERPSDPLRNITLFDGLERVVGGTVAVSLTDFRVPNAGFDGKLGVVGVDGELPGAQLRFGVGRLTAANALSNAQNPANSFFNGSRSFLGQAVSVAGDLPQTTGAAGSLGGVDFDVVDVTSRLTAGQTTARAEVAAGTGDGIQSMLWMLSVATIRPDLSNTTKTVVDLDGGEVLDGDTLEYTVRLANRGNDDAIDVVLADVLPLELQFVAGSLSVTSSAATGILTDSVGDDAGEYDAASRTVRVRLGRTASGTQGGRIPPGEAATVRFRAVVSTGRAGGRVENQASVVFAGASGSPSETVRSDGDALLRGDQSTVVQVAESPEVDAGFVDTGFADAGETDAEPAVDAAPAVDAEPAVDAAPPPDAEASADAEVMDAPMARADATPRADAASARDAEALPEPPDTGCGCAVRGARPRAEPWFLGLMLALAWHRARRVRPRERGDTTQD
jgi:uncharacterized repeat protein (TIGR01451 family)